MEILDKIRLIFSFYLTNKWEENEINRLHLRLLSNYISRFDEVIFCLIIDNDIEAEVIKDFERRIIGECKKDVIFKTYKNTNYRESLVLYEEIAKKLEDLDGLTFFAHNKGMSDCFSIDSVKMWVCALYYFSFEVELPYYQLNGPLSFGPLKFYCCNDFFGSGAKSKYDWYYAGTFFWLKCQQLDFFMKCNNEEVPKMTNRWYSEMFLGNVVPYYEGWSYNNKITVNREFRGEDICDLLYCLYGAEEKILDSFFSYVEENSREI
jgi:hypothetical protein